MSEAVTRGIRVSVESRYLPERSSPSGRQFAFAYTVTITNEGDHPTRLVSRHWVITDADGNVQEVRGDGVVGAQPRLSPGQSFEYTSWCMLPTPHGTMQGTYQMSRDDGDKFDAEIAPFLLAQPNSLN
jgi:ApaG protein